MGFTDEVAAYAAEPRTSRIYEIRDALGKDFDEFVKLLEGDAFSAPAIARTLRARGIVIANSTVTSWRQKLRDGWKP
ncbi:MAG: hypothetical protein EBR82_34000 [Caulobacteraceae bacterium]|nr:hypothetical protein [Caulobacteraceae bacterium]